MRIENVRVIRYQFFSNNENRPEVPSCLFSPHHQSYKCRFVSSFKCIYRFCSSVNAWILCGVIAPIKMSRCPLGGIDSITRLGRCERLFCCVHPGRITHAMFMIREGDFSHFIASFFVFSLR